MNDEDFREKGYIISTDKSLLDFESIYQYLNDESYWSKGIARETLKRAIENSICFGIYHQDERAGFANEQAGFARVITDQATFAYIGDVFVLPVHRGAGLSKWLIQTIKAHPDLQGLRRWSLATADAHGLYSQFGFAVIAHPERWMEIFTPY
ncbi:MAG TPA: GNAT family N-acetyltransferase [Patescibacteria group bacterium]